MMGGQQSSRRITIDNDEPNNVIKVSEKVVERLKGSVEEGAKPEPKPQRSSSPVYIAPTPTARKEVGDNQNVRSHYEDAIVQNNQQWEGKIQKLEERNKKIDALFDFEYHKALKDVEESLPIKTALATPEVPCQDKKAEVLNCYLKNKTQPLLCAKEVEAFSYCLANNRIPLQAGGKRS